MDNLHCLMDDWHCFMDNLVQIFAPEGSNQLGPSTHPTKAPIEPLYLIPTGLTVSFSKINIPWTYFSAVGSALSRFKFSSERTKSNVCKLSWSKIHHRHLELKLLYARLIQFRKALRDPFWREYNVYCSSSTDTDHATDNNLAGLKWGRILLRK